MSSPIQETVFLAVGLFWLGACFGSFANVVILRLPAGLSVVTPRSRCNECQKPISWFDNIPLVSWLILRGKCRNCGTQFSIRYWFVELVMAIFFMSAFLWIGPKWVLLEILIFGFGLITASVIDLDHMILPDRITLPGIVVGMLGSILIVERSFMDSLYGVLLGGGFLWLIAFLYQVVRKAEGLGGGDIKLLAWVGAVLGWKAIPYVILVASVFGSFAGVASAMKSDAGLKAVIPFGPFLSFAALTYVFGGDQIALWYLRLFFPWL